MDKSNEKITTSLPISVGGRTVSVTIVERRNHSEGLLRILAEGDMEGYLEDIFEYLGSSRYDDLSKTEGVHALPARDWHIGCRDKKWSNPKG